MPATSAESQAVTIAVNIMIIPFVFAWMRELGAVSRSNTENASS
jgi:hypothetical protein